MASSHDRLAVHLSSARTVYQLLQLSANGKTEEIKEMLETGVDVNAVDYDKRSALHLAAAEGRFDTVKLLVERGANVNAIDRFGGTPLRDSLECRRYDIVSYLRSHGSTLGEKSDFLVQKVCQAASEGNVLLLESVYENSFLSIDAADYDARTPLHLAAACNHKKASEYLLKKGANPLALDRFGNTAIQEALREGHPELSNFLATFKTTSSSEEAKEEDSGSEDEGDDILPEGEISPQEAHFLEAVSIFINSFIFSKTSEEPRMTQEFNLSSIRETLETEREIFRDFFIFFRNRFLFDERDETVSQEIREKICSMPPSSRQIFDFLLLFDQSCVETNFFIEKGGDKVFFRFTPNFLFTKQDVPQLNKPMQFQFDFQ
mmetsp:Transcript_732/g.1069  ORF Transcript_732/g.1069 Transcript_732/m.1069 type:complete len:376 (-) Transcript_732:111-1238(-)|eukprot:CAMPEP_0201484612 /NCGR_PEP_ID=MMETSP0151_2-20130828/8772_1 /ASSEMBLY_ACC=CAM_ASM_000257 /TAXON_ID=200890 /ORGANISM="Paramoeba atlantica, Strain 621/1 / CCAP 1560/9" /LENGTH=375 /DNA_ID=CAMNT_0047868353 /DNA_START=118 /DNA_END=1245 /DNA_ORIENTATION=+